MVRNVPNTVPTFTPTAMGKSLVLLLSITAVFALKDELASRKPVYKYRYETEDVMQTAASTVPIKGYHVVEGGYYPVGIGAGGAGLVGAGGAGLVGGGAGLVGAGGAGLYGGGAGLVGAGGAGLVGGGAGLVGAGGAGLYGGGAGLVGAGGAGLIGGGAGLVGAGGAGLGGAGLYKGLGYGGLGYGGYGLGGAGIGLAGAGLGGGKYIGGGAGLIGAGGAGAGLIGGAGLYGGGAGLYGGGAGLYGGGAGLYGGGAGLYGGAGLIGGGAGLYGGGAGLVGAGGAGLIGGGAGLVGAGGAGLIGGGAGLVGVPLIHGYGGEVIDKAVYGGGKKNLNDMAFQKAGGSHGAEMHNGKEGFTNGVAAAKNSKGEHAHYNDAAAAKKIADDAKTYYGGQHFDKGGKQGAEFNEKKGHKKGHVIKGFKTSHHKDETGKTEEFYDEANDEGGKLNFNTQGGSFGEKGASSFKGAHANDEFIEGGHKKGGHYDNEHFLDQNNADAGKYGEKKYGGSGSSYGVNNGIDAHSLLGHQENSKVFKHVPFY